MLYYCYEVMIMADSMVTGRMSEQKKIDGVRILQREGPSASQAINLMFDRVIEDQSIGFLTTGTPTGDRMRWEAAAAFVDAIPRKHATRFDDMTKVDMKMDRLRARGLA